MRILLATLAVMFSAPNALAEQYWCPRPKPQVVQCVQPYQAPEANEPHTAWSISLKTDSGILVRYVIDNQFAAVEEPNFPQFFGTRMDYFVLHRLEEECEQAEGERCTVIHTQSMHTGPDTNGGWARPHGPKYE